MQVNDMLDDLQADAKSQTRVVFVFQDGLERLKDQFLLFSRDANARIADFKENVMRLTLHTDGDRAALGEFDRVVDLVQQRLCEPLRIRLKGRQFLLDIFFQADA